MKLIQIAHSWPLRLFTSYSTEYSLLYHRFGYFLDEILAFDRVDHFVPLAIGHLLELKWHLRGWVILYHRLGYLMDFVWHLSPALWNPSPFCTKGWDFLDRMGLVGILAERYTGWFVSSKQSSAWALVFRSQSETEMLQFIGFRGTYLTPKMTE